MAWVVGFEEKDEESGSAGRTKEGEVEGGEEEPVEDSSADGDRVRRASTGGVRKVLRRVVAGPKVLVRVRVSDKVRVL